MGHSSRTLVELLCVGDLSQEQPTALQNSLDQTASPGWERLDFGANSRGEWRAIPTFCICGENPLDVAERKKSAE